MKHHEEQSQEMSAQEISARAFIRELENKFPNIDLTDFLKKHFAKAILGNLPAYSNRHKRGYQVTGVSVATVSAFAILYGRENDIEENVFVLIVRPAGSQNLSPRYGTFGGFVNLDGPSEEQLSAGEQPHEGLVREIAEETMDDNGQPILKISPERLRLVHSGIDYRGCEQDLQSTHNTGYLIQIFQEELVALKMHAQKMKHDPVYRSAVFRASKGEVIGIKILTASEIQTLRKDQFSHPHEFDVLARASKFLKNPDARPEELNHF